MCGMKLFMILFSVYLQAKSANIVGESGSGREEGHRHYDQLLSMLWQETTTQPGFGVDLTTQLQPYFESGLSSPNASVQLGSDVTLHCFVRDLADETKVSWLKRHGDKLNLLSVGSEKYSSEPRLAPGFRAPHDWQLRLLSARQSDEGFYECQVSSHPPITRRFYLAVVVPELEILDERGLPLRVHKFYNSGSTIELKCRISKVPPEQLDSIAWRRGSRLLNRDTIRGGISVKTDLVEEGVLSRLFIANANQRDSGNYSCSLADVTRANVTLVVLNGESPAAMHVSGSERGAVSWTFLLSLFGIIHIFQSGIFQETILRIRR